MIFSIQRYSYTNESLEALRNHGTLDLDVETPQGMNLRAYISMRKSLNVARRLLKNMGNGGQSPIPGIKPQHEAKAAAKIGPSERWITIHPGGEEGKGVPVLIRDNGDGTAHVIAGAGGSVNGLKLNNIKSKEEYAAQTKEKQQKESQAKADKKTQEREAMAGMSKQDLEQYRASQKLATLQEKTKEKEKKSVEEEATKKLVEKFKSTLGWEQEDIDGAYQEAIDQAKQDLVNAKDTEDPEQIKEAKKNLKRIEQGYNRAKKSQEQHATTTAKEMMRDFQRRMLLDPELKAQVEQAIGDDAGIGDVIKRENSGKSKGFSSDFKEKAEALGLTGEELASEKKDVIQENLAKLAEKDPKTAEFVQKGIEANQEINEIRKDFYGDKEELPKVADIDQKAELLKTYLEYKRTLDEVKKKDKKSNLTEVNLDGTPEEIAESVDRLQYGNGSKLDYSELLSQSLEDEADRMSFERQANLNRSLLEAIENNPGGVEKWIANGNYNGLNSIALQAMKTEGIDRNVVDVLGIGNAAKIQAMMMREALTDESYKDVAKAMEQYHQAMSEGLVKDAVDRGNELIARAESIKLDIANNPEDLAIQSELNETRLEYLDEANRVMGQALGSLEASAAMVAELKGMTGSPEAIEANLGKISAADAIVRMRAIGLQKGDYSFDNVNGDRVVTIKGDAIDKLMRPVSAEDIEIENTVSAIKSGGLDEAGWLPDGVIRRDADTFNDPGPGNAPAGDINAQTLGENAEEIKQTEEVAHRVLGSMPEGRFAFSDVDDLSPQDMTDLRRYWEQNIYSGSMAEGTAERQYTQKGVSKQSTWNDFVKKNDGDSAKTLDAIKANLLTEKYSPPGVFGDPDLHPLARVEIDKPETYSNIPGMKEYIEEIVSREEALSVGAYSKELIKEEDYQGDLEKKKELEDKADEKVRQNLSREIEIMRNQMPSKAKELYTKAMRDHYLDNMSGITDFKEGSDREEKSPWGEYVRMHGDVVRAQEAILDRIRGEFMDKFIKNYRGVTGKSLKTGVQKIRNHRDHVFAMLDKESRDGIIGKVQAELASAGASVANRQGGKFASGSWKEKALQYMEEKAKADAAQGDLFGGEDLKQNDGTEILTIGKRAEEQLKQLVPQLAANQRRGQKYSVFPGMSMEGNKHVQQQRAIKMFDAVKRMNLTFGTGKGKSITSIGAFTHLKGQGKVKRGIFAVPSVVQAQFGNEGNTYLEPGKYKWSANPGMSQEDRIKAMRDGNMDMVVTTHQSLRDDMVHLMAKQNGIDENEMKARFNGASPQQRKEMLGEALKTNGIGFDMLTVDESHYESNRKGKEDSTLSNVLDALNQHTPYYMRQSATPVKNDISEAWDMLHKVAPEKFGDRSEFIKRYGVDSEYSKKELQRLVNRYSYASPTVTGVKRNENQEKVTLHPDQKAEYDKVNAMYRRASNARYSGKVDVEAMKFLSPNSFKGQPEDKHQEIAKNLQRAAGTIKEEALNRVVNQFDWKRNAKIDRLMNIVDSHKYESDHPKTGSRKGQNKPGVVFAHNIQTVENMRQSLESKGLRVGVIQGAMSGADKEKVKNGFNPTDPKARKYDVILLSDAGATGMNLQNAGYLVNFDLPQTAWTKTQREGRIDRHGQAHDEISYHDLISDTDHEKKKIDRVKRKKQLGAIFEEEPGQMDDTGLMGYIQSVREEKRNNGITA